MRGEFRPSFSWWECIEILNWNHDFSVQVFQTDGQYGDSAVSKWFGQERFENHQRVEKVLNEFIFYTFFLYILNNRAHENRLWFCKRQRMIENELFPYLQVILRIREVGRSFEEKLLLFWVGDFTEVTGWEIRTYRMQDVVSFLRVQYIDLQSQTKTQLHKQKHKVFRKYLKGEILPEPFYYRTRVTDMDIWRIWDIF